MFDIGHGEGSVVKHRCGQNGIGMAAGERIVKMFDRAAAAGGDNRDTDRLADARRDFQVVPRQLAVLVHAGEQDLSGSPPFNLQGPLLRIDPGGPPTAVGKHFPMLPLAFDIHGDHDALGTEALGPLGNQFRVEHRGGVDGNLVGAGRDDLVDVFQSGDAASDGEGDEQYPRQPCRQIDREPSLLVAGRDVQKNQFIRGLVVVSLGQFQGIAGVAQPDEAHPFDDPALFDVQTGNDPLGQHCAVAPRVIFPS